MFKSNFFGVADVPIYGKSGLTRKNLIGNQMSFVSSLCIRLPILAFQEMNRRTGVVRNIRTSGTDKDCVTFRPVPLVLLVELEWEGRDDLDLTLEEPNGETLSKFNQRSENGVFRADRNTENCFRRSTRSGKEVIAYQSDADSGTYTVTAVHFDNCGDGPTKWNLRVTLGNALLLNKSGEDDESLSSEIFNFTFNV